jgi:para-aminobenzoate synthetase/4-amino-4-deoxychorismate lyase
LRGFLEAIVATTPDEVEPALSRVERAARDGAWAAGFVAYEAAGGLEAALTTTPSPQPVAVEVPLVWFGVFSRCDVVAPLEATPQAPRKEHWTLDVDASRHARQVATVREHIAAGDVYQCNLTARYQSQVEDPWSLYRRLALSQRTSHGMYVHAEQFAVASASPELFFEWSGDRVVTRPMKGTSARGRSAEADRDMAAALAGSPKDRAENVMIVDLVRNDLGKIAPYGTVTVPALWTLERYPTVWQLTSTVESRVAASLTLVELFRALFPSGSVTGAPKRRAMQVIADLEATPRGVYCGALGVVSPSGSGVTARFSVPIRTAVVDRRTGTAVYGSGGGIVWDSRAAAEYSELVAKAAVLTSEDPGEMSLLETMLALPDSGVWRWDRHRARLLGSAAYFGIDVGEAALDRAVAQATSSVQAPSRVRLLVDPAALITVEVDLLEPSLSEPVVLAVDHEPVDTSSAWLSHKTTNRWLYDERAKRHPHADQVVLVNERGEVTETNVANLAINLDGTWWTPPVDAGCLPGVARAELVEAGRLHERPITLEELATADGLAVVSSLRGWRTATLTH